MPNRRIGVNDCNNVSHGIECKVPADHRRLEAFFAASGEGGVREQSMLSRVCTSAWRRYSEAAKAMT
jgi:hypothetical protein